MEFQTRSMRALEPVKARWTAVDERCATERANETTSAIAWVLLTWHPWNNSMEFHRELERSNLEFHGMEFQNSTWNETLKIWENVRIVVIKAVIMYVG